MLLEKACTVVVGRNLAFLMILEVWGFAIFISPILHYWLNKEALIVKPDSLVACIFKAKYYPNDNFCGARLGGNASYVWHSIFAARKVLKDGMGWIVGSSANISIWRDSLLPTWAGCKIYSTLINNSIWLSM